jgi:hypothetical protein
MKGTVTITIDENGNPTVGVEGVAGPDCAKLTKSIENALGEVKSDTKTKEFSQHARAGVGQTVKAGS